MKIHETRILLKSYTTTFCNVKNNGYVVPLFVRKMLHSKKMGKFEANVASSLIKFFKFGTIGTKKEFATLFNLLFRPLDEKTRE